MRDYVYINICLSTKIDSMINYIHHSIFCCYKNSAFL